MNFRFLALLIILFIASCARVGQPTGGEKDTQPPVLLKSFPSSNQTNFKGDEIILVFDEYVQLKNPDKNILISPPSEQKPVIFPSGFASKEFKIKFKNGLQKNTTYLINFGESIADYNEGNLLKNLQLIFSTGDQLDSLELKGKVYPSHMKEKPEKILIGLYPAQEFQDSSVYRKNPYYVTMADKNGNFKLLHLRKGTYNVIAIADQNGDYKYKQGDEAIAFLNKPVQIPEDTLINLFMFKEPERFDIEDIEQKSANHISIKFKGNPDSLQVKPLSQITEKLTYLNQNTFHYWYKTVLDSINLEVILGPKHKFYKRKRKSETDSLVINFSNYQISPDDQVLLKSNIPLIKVDSTKISCAKDSFPATFKVDINKNYQVIFDLEKIPGTSYHVTVYPGAVTDFLGHQNQDTLQSDVRIKKPEKFGTVHLILEPQMNVPVFIELLRNGKIIKKTPTLKNSIFNFQYIMPGEYQIRIVFDKNENNEWDAGNYLLHKQPEKTYKPPVKLEVRANWDLNQTIKIPIAEFLN